MHDKMETLMETFSQSSTFSDDLTRILGLSPEILEYLKSSIDGEQLEWKFIKDSGGKVTLSFTYFDLESAKSSSSAKVPAKTSCHIALFSIFS